jgi:3-hydroxyisobutyrate dehydrogenase
MTQAAFLGLGAMGWHMAANLRRAGLLGAVWNRTVEKAQRFAAEHGVPAVAAPADVWAHADTAVLCVSADDDVRAVVQALAVPAARGKCVVDSSTVSADTAREAARTLAAVSARFVDAPVTGGTEGAKHARLNFMVGGAPGDVEAVRPLFEAMGARAVHLGETGAGQAAKAVNQVVAAGINQAVAQGLAFAAALGLPLEKIIEVVGSGAAGSWFMQNRGPFMARGDYPPGFRVALHLKDLRICQAMSGALGGALPLVDQTAADYERLIGEGHGDEDTSALYRLQGERFARKA